MAGLDFEKTRDKLAKSEKAKADKMWKLVLRRNQYEMSELWSGIKI